MQTNMLEDYYTEYIEEKHDYYYNNKLRKMKIFFEKIRNFDFKVVIDKLSDKNIVLEKLVVKAREKKVIFS